MLSVEDYPAVRANPDRAAKLEDCMFMVLASVPLREAQQHLHAWHLGMAITEEQCAVMFMMLNERSAREEAA